MRQSETTCRRTHKQMGQQQYAERPFRPLVEQISIGLVDRYEPGFRRLCRMPENCPGIRLKRRLLFKSYNKLNEPHSLGGAMTCQEHKRTKVTGRIKRLPVSVFAELRRERIC